MTETKLINQVIQDYQKQLDGIDPHRTKAEENTYVDFRDKIEGLKCLKKELDDYRTLKEVLKRVLS